MRNILNIKNKRFNYTTIFVIKGFASCNFLVEAPFFDISLVICHHGRASAHLSNFLLTFLILPQVLFSFGNFVHDMNHVFPGYMIHPRFRKLIHWLCCQRIC